MFKTEYRDLKFAVLVAPALANNSNALLSKVWGFVPKTLVAYVEDGNFAAGVISRVADQ